MLKACAYHKPNKRYIYDNFNSCERFKRSIFFCFAMSLIGLGSFEQGLVWLRVGVHQWRTWFTCPKFRLFDAHMRALKNITKHLLVSCAAYVVSHPFLSHYTFEPWLYATNQPGT